MNKRRPCSLDAAAVGLSFLSGRPGQETPKFYTQCVRNSEHGIDGRICSDTRFKSADYGLIESGFCGEGVLGDPLPLSFLRQFPEDMPHNRFSSLGFSHGYAFKQFRA